ncbi:MAG: cytochrome c oxidase assembly protein [Gammaproteobacteria bacterium]|nr:cytochrome c oxidase assembly protein [Gammaproteobacteria bacterium]
MTRKLLLVTAIMFGFGFALVPLYDVFCDVTGLNGKTGGQVTSSEAQEIDKSRLITVQFLANLNENMPWEFMPVTGSIKVHPGEATIIEYVARNKSDHAIIGQAVPSVSPGQAAEHFKKTECFCFTEQKLEAGEEKLMPVNFTVDTDLPANVNEVTLSYTFFIKPSSSSADNAKLPADMNHDMNHNMNHKQEI